LKGHTTVPTTRTRKQRYKLTRRTEEHLGDKHRDPTTNLPVHTIERLFKFVLRFRVQDTLSF
jgi:hypothetical protein